MLDIDMPNIGGIEAAKKLRLLFPDCCPLLIAMSGVVALGPVETSKVFDHVFPKPLDLDAVIRCINAA